MDVLTRPRTLHRLAIANLLANMAIVWTGSLVRLTDSGLGCPTWPQCDTTSYLPHPASPWHTYVEFGNRLLTFVLIAISLATFLASVLATRRREVGVRVPRMAFVVGVGIIAQAVIGGISVLVKLNPWVVGLHMVVSVGLIVLCARIEHEVAGRAAQPVEPRRWWLVQGIFWASMAMMYLGTVTSGSGPHSGDGAATRNGFDLSEVARVHSLTLWLTLGATVVLFWLSKSDGWVRTRVLRVIGVAAGQAAIGYAQYLLHLPEGLVFAHMIGTTLYTVVVAQLWFAVRHSPAQH